MEENINNNSTSQEKYKEFLKFTAKQRLELCALIVHLQNAEKSLNTLIDMDKNPVRLTNSTKYKGLIRQGLKPLTTRVLEAYRRELKQLDTKHPLDAVEANRQVFLSHINLYNRLHNIMDSPKDSLFFLGVIEALESPGNVPPEVEKWLAQFL